MPDKGQGRVDFHGLSQCKTLQISGSRGSIVAVRKQGYDNEEVHHGGACALEGKEEGSLKQKNSSCLQGSRLWNRVSILRGLLLIAL